MTSATALLVDALALHAAPDARTHREAALAAAEETVTTTDVAIDVQGRPTVAHRVRVATSLTAQVEVLPHVQ